MKNYFLTLLGALSFCVTLLAQSGTSSDAMTTTAHISAPKGAFAKTVLMPGDPLRAKTPEERETSFTNMIRLALETAISDTVTGLSETAAPTDGNRDGKYLENSRLVIRKGDRRYSTEGIPVQ